MCYSAQIKAEYLQFVRHMGLHVSLREFVDLYWRRATDARLRIPKALDGWFAEPRSDEEREIAGLIERFEAEESARLEQELFRQRKRLADAQRQLQTKPTKAAAEHQRIAGDKVAWALGKLSDLRRRTFEDRDARFFPGWYAPVIVVEDGRRVVKPMRYQCRPAGKPAAYDRQYPGTYNARRDNLEGGFWRPLFGRSHGLLVVSRFYENVARDGQNVVLEFDPRPGQDMLVACLWSRWSAPGEPDLLSFAAITDEPPPEVAAAGHDRCIVPIKAEHVDAWLQPDPKRLRDLYAILDERERPYYEHRLAA